MMKHLLNQIGATAVEGLMGAAMVGGLAVGMLTISDTQKNAQMGMTGASELEREMQTIRAYVTDPLGCQINFENRSLNSEMTEIKNSKGDVVYSVGGFVANQAYKISSIRVGGFNTATSRTTLTFNFEKKTPGGSPTAKKNIFLYTNSDGTKISECFDPVKDTSLGALYKTCVDADPLKVGICEQTLTNLVKEVRSLYCQNNPILKLDPVTEKCMPLDAGKSCGASYVRGWDAAGNLICYAGPSNPIPPPATCMAWNPWTPALDTICPDETLTQTRTCSSPGVSETQTQTVSGTKPGCGAINCSISYQARNDSKSSPMANNGGWALYKSGADRDCNDAARCGIVMGLSCTGASRVRLSYQYQEANAISGEESTGWSDPSGSLTMGPWALASTTIQDECDGKNCGLRVRAEAENGAPCTVKYQYKQESRTAPEMSNGSWSVVNNAGGADENCDDGSGCGIRATISCTPL